MDTGGAVSNQLTNYAILLFLYDLANPGAPLGGAITGKVLRSKWDPGATSPTYEPVKGALVSGVDAAGNPLFTSNALGDPATVAVSQADGTYSLLDRQFTGGAVTISATVGGVMRTATAYEVDPQNAKSPGLRFAKNIATAHITFPAIAPAVPPSPVQVTVLTLDANGVRKNSTGIVVAGEPLVIGVKAGGMTVQRLQVKNGSDTTEYGVRIDPQAGQNPAAFDVIADGSVTFALPGSYTITATALNPNGGVVTGHTVIRAVVAGGGNNDALPNDPPSVITVRTVPKANATGVQIGALPQIAFTEPVQNVPAGVTLTEENGPSIGVVLSAVGPNGPIANLTPQSIVTSLTIQPSAGLKYGTQYTLSLSSDIVDTDTAPNPNKPLVPYTTSFTTFAPESIGQTEDLFTAGGMAVIGDRAYIATPQNVGRYFTNLRLFDVSDPTSPLEIASNEPQTSGIFKAPPMFWLGLPVDVVADEESPLTGGPVVAVATTPLVYPYHASNVRLYDVSNEGQWKWIGAVSLGRDPTDGMIRRIEMKGSMLYAVTAGIGKGIQFVDLNIAQESFNAALVDGEQSAAYWQMQGQLNSTEGFAPEAIVNTVHVDTGLGANSQLWDLAVTDLTFNGVTQPTVIATGRSPLAIATQTDGLLYNGDITDGLGGPPKTSWGYGVAAGTVAGIPIAVVSAMGPAGSGLAHVLAVVDLTNPAAPRAMAILPLSGSASGVQDVALRDSTVFVVSNSGADVINLSTPSSPLFVGTIAGISGRVAFRDSVVLSTRRGLTETTNASGGVKLAALGAVAIVRSVAPIVVNVDENDRTLEPIKVRYQLLGTGGVADTGSLLLSRNGNEVMRTGLTGVTDGTFEVEIPVGIVLSTPSDALNVSLRLPDGRLTDPFTTIIANPSGPDDATETAEETLVAIEPSLITRGATDVRVTATLDDPSAVHFVRLMNELGAATTVPFTRASSTSGTFIVPATMLQQPAVIRVELGSAQRAMLLVAASGLPFPGGDINSEVTEVSPENLLEAAGLLQIHGNGFAPGSKVLFGRSQRAALILDTEFIEEDTLVAHLPPLSLGADLFVSVISPDGQLASSSFAVQSESWRDHPGHLEPADIRLSSIKSSLVWNQGSQSMFIDAFNLPEGTTAVVTRAGESTSLELPLQAASIVSVFASTSVPTPEKRKVVIPKHVTDYPAFDASVEVSGETLHLQSPRSYFVPQEPFAIPFGGRRKFYVRKDVATGAQEVLMNAVPRPSPGAAVARRLVPADAPVTVSIASSDANRPDIRVEREIDPDPTAFYLRGLRLTTDPDTGVNRGTSQLTVSNGATGAYQVSVMPLSLGNRNNTHDADIRKVANRYGIPPEFLKRQVENESGFRERSYRYEPTTIDMLTLSGDLTIANGFGPTVLNGTTRWIDAYPFDRYRLAGPRIASIDKLKGAFEQATRLPDGTYSIPGELMSRAGAITAANQKARIELRVPNSSRIIDTSVEPFAVWSSSKRLRQGRQPQGSREFSVDYATGIIRLGAPLSPSETLEVRVDRSATANIPSDGAFVGFDLAKASEQLKLTYFPGGDTIATFMQTNFETYPTGAWFATDSDKRLEFRFDESAQRPTAPIDTRHLKARAQFFAGASYGPLQLTLLPWTEANKKAAFETILKVENEPLYVVATNWDRGLSLGAAFHRSTASDFDFSCSSDCNADGWERTWSEVFKVYGPFAPVYEPGGDGKSTIIRDAAKYQPR